jgi:CHAT domain-containing protein/tetratricopeptide (TPR) repeat protein
VEQLYRQAAEGFAKTGSEEGEVLAGINLSQILTRLGRAREAEEEVRRVLAITEASPDLGLRAWGKVILARHLLDSGDDLDRAHELLRAVEIPLSMNDSFSLRRDRLILLGNISMLIGRFREARSAYLGLVDMAVSADDRYLEATARYNLAWVAYERLREAPSPSLRAETVRLAKEALRVASGASNRSVEALAAWMVGVLTTGNEGIAFLERCYQMAEGADLRSHCLNPLASRLASTDPKRAQKVITSSRELAERSGDGWAEVRVRQEAMRVNWAVKSPERALAACSADLGAIEILRDRQPEGSGVQAGMFSVWSDEYAWLAGRLLEEAGKGLEIDQAIAEAFRVGERMRARALADWLRRAGPDTGGADAIEFRSLEEVRTALRPEEALLSFQVARWEDVAGDFGGGSWLLAVTRDGVTVHRLPGRVEVRRAVRLFEGLIERRDGSEAGPAAHLYQKLLAPALAELPPEVDRLILVPDDALHRLPFAALRASADAEPLGAQYELVQVPSATLWLDWRRARPAAPGRPLLVLADPELPMANQAAGPVEVTVAQVRDAAGTLGRLPHARREGRAAVRALGDGLLLIGAEASEARLGALRLRDFGLVHFAAHAVTDEDQPERSAVLLAAGGAHDGRLQSAEIAGLDLAGRTVVLASCRSASGSVLRGEGVMSLGRAFFQAGAHGVVASLWPLRDDESAALFGRFYRHLAEGATVGEALHGARREAIAAGEPAAAWAGLVVLGDGSLVPVPGGRRSGLPGGVWWVAIVSIVLVGAIAAAVAMRRFRGMHS